MIKIVFNTITVSSPPLTIRNPVDISDFKRLIRELGQEIGLSISKVPQNPKTPEM